MTSTFTTAVPKNAAALEVGKIYRPTFAGERVRAIFDGIKTSTVKQRNAAGSLLNHSITHACWTRA